VTRRRGLVAVALVGLLAALLLVVARRGERAAAPPAAGAPDRLTTGGAPVAPDLARVPGEDDPFDLPEPPFDPTETIQPPEAPPEDLPPETQRLAEEFEPGTTEWDDVPVDDSGALRLRVLPARYNVVVPDPIVVFLEVVDERGRRVAAPRPGVRIRPFDDVDERGWIELPVRDDGKGGDARARDHRYTARLAPDPAQRARLLGRVLVEARIEDPEAGVRRLPHSLIYTLGPPAQVGPRWRDWAEGGHLYLQAEVDVAEPGHFTLTAQLTGPEREPIAWLRNARELPRGRHPMTLQVWGRLLREVGVDGPYRVRGVLLTRDRPDGDYDPSRTIDEAHRTAAYRAADFTDAVWVPPPRVIDEVGDTHPSQQDKPPPERQRAYQN
jgi:hypothetical protein